MLSLSANGNRAGTGILWASTPLDGDANQAIVHGILHAYDTGTLVELWNSQQVPGRDGVGWFGKFNSPTVAHGRVYLGTFAKPSGTAYLDVYGLLSRAASPGGGPAATGGMIGPARAAPVSADGLPPPQGVSGSVPATGADPFDPPGAAAADALRGALLAPAVAAGIGAGSRFAPVAVVSLRAAPSQSPLPSTTPVTGPTGNVPADGPAAPVAGYFATATEGVSRFSLLGPGEEGEGEVDSWVPDLWLSDRLFGWATVRSSDST
jgi:hypothetical protein